MKVRVEFRPREMWIGICVEKPDYASLTQRLFISLLPCLPIVITWRVRAYE